MHLYIWSTCLPNETEPIVLPDCSSFAVNSRYERHLFITYSSNASAAIYIWIFPSANIINFLCRNKSQCNEISIHHKIKFHRWSVLLASIYPIKRTHALNAYQYTQDDIDGEWRIGIFRFINHCSAADETEEWRVRETRGGGVQNER